MTDKVFTADTSPAALLKQAVTGAKAAARMPAAPSPAAARTRTGFPVAPRLAAIAGGALALGAVIGAGAMQLAGGGDVHAADTMAQIQARLESGRADTERLHAQLERMARSLSQVQESGDALRTETKTRGAALTDRLTRIDQTLTAKIGSLGEKIDQAEREQIARFAALTEKKSAPPAPAAPAPTAAKSTPAEPAETGAIADKPKSAPTDAWAVREVYDGIAMLEDRKRRLVEVGPGDMVPGVGRIESIERRGKTWVVVTRQGVITQQAW